MIAFTRQDLHPSFVHKRGYLSDGETKYIKIGALIYIVDNDDYVLSNGYHYITPFPRNDENWESDKFIGKIGAHEETFILGQQPITYQTAKGIMQKIEQLQKEVDRFKIYP